jgi:hypothetical protein
MYSTNTLHKFFDQLINNLPNFYSTLRNEIKKQHKEQKLIEELEEKEKSPLKKWDNLAYFDQQTHEKKNTGEEDEAMKQIREEFNWELFNALIVNKFAFNIKYFFETAYREASAPSLIAKTAFTCLTLWCTYLQRRLISKQMEVIISTQEANELDDDEIGMGIHHSQSLMEMVNTLSHAQPLLKEQKKSKQELLPTVLEKRKANFQSHLTAMPELGIDINFISTSTIAEWSRNITTFKSSPVAQQLWQYLSGEKSSAEFISQSGQETESVSKVITDKERVSFSEDIDIVKAKEKIISFCVNKVIITCTNANI